VKATPVIVTLLICIAALMVAHMVTEGHRYDVVALGPNQSVDDMAMVHAFLVDHKTGKTWAVSAMLIQPMVRVTCKQSHPNSTETDYGCTVPSKDPSPEKQ
jgi:hypothetical protein